MFKAQREPIELHMFWQTWHAINDEWQNLLGFDREPVSVADKILTPSPMNNPMVFVMISMGRILIQCSAHGPEHIH